MNGRVLASFVLGAAVGAGGTYLALSRRHGTGPFRANRTGPAAAVEPAAATWARPLDVPHLENLHRVSDDLYRGAQPGEEGFRRLKAMGVRTVVNLRSFHSDRDEIGPTDLDCEHITMKAYHPEGREVVRFLRIVTDPSRTPVFVHCRYGSDRTGLMCAAYRVAVQGWSKDEAAAEMTRGGFGFHETFDGLVEYLRDLDVADIRRRAGLPTTRPAGGD